MKWLPHLPWLLLNLPIEPLSSISLARSSFPSKWGPQFILWYVFSTSWYLQMCGYILIYVWFLGVWLTEHSVSYLKTDCYIPKVLHKAQGLKIHLLNQWFSFGVILPLPTPSRTFPGGSVVKNLPAHAGAAGDIDSIPGSGRSPEGGNSNPLQYSCLDNPMDREAWQDTVHGVAKCWMWLSTHEDIFGGYNWHLVQRDQKYLLLTLLQWAEQSL